MDYMKLRKKSDGEMVKIEEKDGDEVSFMLSFIFKNVWIPNLFCMTLLVVTKHQLLITWPTLRGWHSSYITFSLCKTSLWTFSSAPLVCCLCCVSFALFNLEGLQKAHWDLLQSLFFSPFLCLMAILTYFCFYKNFISIFLTP